MHIPDGMTNMGVNAAGFAVAACAVGAAVNRARKSDCDSPSAPLLGITGAFIFAVQMLNVPIAAGASAHFLGAMFAALMLGPVNAVLVFATVVGAQCLMLGDGGLTALGLNIANMGIAAPAAGWAAFAALRAVAPRTKHGFVMSAAFAAWVSVMVSTVACALEIGLSGTVPLRVILPTMCGINAVGGAGEAVVTGAMVSFILGVRPDLVYAWTCRPDTLLKDAA